MAIIVTHSERETITAGEQLARKLSSGNVVALFGDLGSGKTHFTKGISMGLGVKGQVTSPTFIVVNEHRGGRIPLFHFDFYRLRSIDELQEIGFDDYIYGDGICVVEWADIVRQYLPEHRYNIFLELGVNEHERIITIEEPQ